MEKKDKNLIDLELEKIVGLLAVGDYQAALRLFWRDYYTPLKKKMQSRLTDLRDFPEILNDVLLDISKRELTFSDGEHLMRYIIKAVKNDIIDRGKKRGLVITPLEDWDPAYLPTDTTDVIECRNIIMKIHRSIDEMRGNMKKVMDLYFREGKTLLEIEGILSIPNKQVNIYRRRGIKKLQEEHSDIRQIIDKETFKKVASLLGLIALFSFLKNWQ